MGVEAVVSGDESLAAEDFEDARDAAGEGVGGIKDGGVHVGDGDGAGEPAGVEGIGLAGDFYFFEKFDGGLSPDTPVTE